MLRVRQLIEAPRLDDVAAHTEDLLAAFGLEQRIHPGDRVAVAVGSRGIRDLVPVLATLVGAIRRAGGRPSSCPAWAATEAPPPRVRPPSSRSSASREAAVGAPVVSTMDVVEIGRSRFGAPVWASTDFLAADAIVVVNRVKPHTDFTGPIESGIAKMLVIGAGKHRGAVEAHRLFVRHGFPAVIDEYAGVLLARLPVLFALAVIENQFDQTAELHLLGRDEVLAREPALLRRACELMPSLPFSRLDCLVVDEMGKDVSGSGMDTNVIGRKPAGDGSRGGTRDHPDRRPRPHPGERGQRPGRRDGRLHHHAARRRDRR